MTKSLDELFEEVAKKLGMKVLGPFDPVPGLFKKRRAKKAGEDGKATTRKKVKRKAKAGPKARKKAEARRP